MLLFEVLSAVVIFVLVIAAIRRYARVSSPATNKLSDEQKARNAEYRRDFLELHGAKPDSPDPIAPTVSQQQARLNVQFLKNGLPYVPSESPPIDKDAWDPWWPPPSERAKITAHLHLTYLDANHNKTERDVTVRYIGTIEGNINAYCHLRRGNRVFRDWRILHCINRETGEVWVSPWLELTRLHGKSEQPREADGQSN